MLTSSRKEEYLVTPDGKLNPNARLRYNDSFADALFDNAFRQNTMYLHQAVTTAQITMYLWAFWTMTLTC